MLRMVQVARVTPAHSLRWVSMQWNKWIDCIRPNKNVSVPLGWPSLWCDRWPMCPARHKQRLAPAFILAIRGWGFCSQFSTTWICHLVTARFWQPNFCTANFIVFSLSRSLVFQCKRNILYFRGPKDLTEYYFGASTEPTSLWIF